MLEPKIPTIVEPNKDIGAASPHDAIEVRAIKQARTTWKKNVKFRLPTDPTFDVFSVQLKCNKNTRYSWFKNLLFACIF